MARGLVWLTRLASALCTGLKLNMRARLRTWTWLEVWFRVEQPWEGLDGWLVGVAAPSTLGLFFIAIQTIGILVFT